MGMLAGTAPFPAMCLARPHGKGGASWSGLLSPWLQPGTGCSQLAVSGCRTRFARTERLPGRTRLASLWVAVPVVVSHFALLSQWPGAPAFSSCRALVRTTRVLFGHGAWFHPLFPDSRGLGVWINHGDDDLLLGVQLILASVLPAAVALTSFLRIVARRRWVHLVAKGRIPGWVLTDATARAPADIPVLTRDGRGLVKGLARVHDTVDPYRAADAEPVALVELRMPWRKKS